MFAIRPLSIALLIVYFAAATAADDEKPTLRVGVGERDVTPQSKVPMWGYGARHAELSGGIADPLMAKAIVIQAGDDKLAIVGVDLGRGPTIAMMKQIREELKLTCSIEHVIIGGSHSHHGPVIELTDKQGRGKDRFADAVAYNQQLPGLLIEAVKQADASLQSAKLGVGVKNVSLNRNRHSKRRPKAVEPMLAVVRFDDAQGKPMAVLVNFAAHPTMFDAKDLRFSADYPGAMKKKVESQLATKCVFMQGASGDLSANPPAGVSGSQQFGEALADQVIEVAAGIKTESPEHPEIVGKVDRFLFDSRVDFGNQLIVALFSRAFFPELAQAYADEVQAGIPAELNTVLLNREIGLVSGSGEFFCNHSNRLKERSYLKHTLFFGYANGHNLYFPTIEGASEGGYGADVQVSPVELGAGEAMMNRALMNLYHLQGKFALEPALKAKRDQESSN